MNSAQDTDKAYIRGSNSEAEKEGLYVHAVQSEEEDEPNELHTNDEDHSTGIESVTASRSDTRPESKTEPRTKESYTKHDDSTKEKFFFLVYEKGLTGGQAGRELNVALRTAYDWLAKDQKDIQEQLNPSPPKKRACRRAMLTREHEDYLEKQFREFPSATLQQVMESLTNEFKDLKISKTIVYNFMINKCALSFKKVVMPCEDKNSPEMIETRYEWATTISTTDIDYRNNCVFIDEAAFYVNLKRTMVWSKKVQTPMDSKLKARTTTLIGAISSHGVIEVKLRRPLALADTASTGHYYNFILSTLDIMDQQDRFKGNYIVMNNAPNSRQDIISQLILSRGYRYLHLPANCPELNPMEPFWTALSHKLNREKLAEEETLSIRVSAACAMITLLELEEYCLISSFKINDCLNKIPF